MICNSLARFLLRLVTIQKGLELELALTRLLTKETFLHLKITASKQCLVIVVPALCNFVTLEHCYDLSFTGRLHYV